MKDRSVLGVILSRIVGLLIFLVLLGLANIIQVHIHSDINRSIIQFLNNNLGLVILFSIIFLLGELFSILKFPFNLPYPIFNAFGSLFLIKFLLRIFFMINEIINLNVFLAFNFLAILVYPLVFLLVLIVGYINIFVDLTKPKEKLKTKRKKNVQWEDIGEEIKETLYDLIKKIRNDINKKRSKKEK